MIYPHRNFNEILEHINAVYDSMAKVPMIVVNDLNYNRSDKDDYPLALMNILIEMANKIKELEDRIKDDGK